MNKKIAFVKVPKTAGSAIFQDVDINFCRGLLDLQYNDSCYIKHSLPYHYGNTKQYCSFPDFEQSICSSAYKNLHDHDHFFYTQVRDPYDMACSLYFFLKRKSAETKLPASIIGSNVDADYHNSKLIMGGASINEFLENMKHNQTYTHYYDFLDIEDFDCVGQSSDFEKTKNLLEVMFNINIKTHITNVNPNKNINEPYNFNFNQKMFELLNQQEYEIFNRGIKKINALVKKYL